MKDFDCLVDGFDEAAEAKLDLKSRDDETSMHQNYPELDEEESCTHAERDRQRKMLEMTNVR